MTLRGEKLAASTCGLMGAAMTELESFGETTSLGLTVDLAAISFG